MMTVKDNLQVILVSCHENKVHNLFCSNLAIEITVSTTIFQYR